MKNEPRIKELATLAEGGDVANGPKLATSSVFGAVKKAEVISSNSLSTMFDNAQGTYTSGTGTSFWSPSNTADEEILDMGSVVAGERYGVRIDWYNYYVASNTSNRARMWLEIGAAFFKMLVYINPQAAGGETATATVLINQAMPQYFEFIAPSSGTLSLNTTHDTNGNNILYFQPDGLIVLTRLP